MSLSKSKSWLCAAVGLTVISWVVVRGGNKSDSDQPVRLGQVEQSPVVKGLPVQIALASFNRVEQDSSAIQTSNSADNEVLTELQQVQKRILDQKDPIEFKKVPALDRPSLAGALKTDSRSPQSALPLDTVEIGGDFVPPGEGSVNNNRLPIPASKLPNSFQRPSETVAKKMSESWQSAPGDVPVAHVANPIPSGLTWPSLSSPDELSKFETLETGQATNPDRIRLASDSSNATVGNRFNSNSGNADATAEWNGSESSIASTNSNDFVIPGGSSAPGEPGGSSEPHSSKSNTLLTTSPRNQNPSVALNAGSYQLAEQPQLGQHYRDETPQVDSRAWTMPADGNDFSPGPAYENSFYDPYEQIEVYQGKRLHANQRPLIELGRPWYQLGQLPEASNVFGFHNPVSPQFILFGDSRVAYANNSVGEDQTSQVAFEVNLNFNLQLTSTERFHMIAGPLDNGGGRNTRYFFGEDRFDEELDFDIDAGYFEGDMGAIVGGLVGETLPFDMPFAIGVMPLLVQNGVWMEDAFLGVATTIPARNSARLGISNMDITFFAGFDEIISPAFELEDDTARMYGVMSFIEALNGYLELDYAFLEDRNSARDRSYHNIGISYTRRYGRFISNSTRLLVNAGQSTAGGQNTADGFLLLSENSLISGAPSTVVPYMNFFAGFDRPQSAARNAAAGGVLRNTGILFESDGMTGFPTLDATANDTFGVAMGLNLLPDDFSQQLVVEAAAMGVRQDDPNRNAANDQYGVGFRYQLPLTNAVILRADGMFGFLRSADDVHGVRLELRHKY